MTSRVDARRGACLVALLAALLVVGCSPADESSDTAAPDDPPTEEPTLEPDPEPAPANEREAEPDQPAPPPEPPPVPESRAALVARLQPLVDAAADRAESGTLAVLVTDEYGREVVAHRPDTPVMPASTMKNVTAASLLVTLGPDARFTTLVDATAPIDDAGVLDGDLVLFGVGDPALATDEYGRWIYPARPRTPFESLADQLVELGLTHLTGDVVGVAGDFTGDGRAEGWRDRYFSDFDARFIAGLTLDAGLVTRLRYPQLEEALEEALHEALAERGDDEPADDAEVIEAVLDLDDVDLDDLRPEELADLLGLDGPGPPEARIEMAGDPTLHAARELIRLLDDRGVTVDGEPRAGDAPEPIVGRLARVESPPLGELLRFAVKRSDNHMTDQLFHVIARVRTGEGSWERGDRAVRQVLDHLGIDHAEAWFADGSGLSRDDRLTARLLVDLDRAMTASRHGEVWASLMAVMGEDGTLRQRLVGTPAQGRFFGKTGTLDDVTALTGSVLGDEGRYHLAVIANDPGDGRWAARILMDELILALVADLDGCAVRPAPGAEDTMLGRPPTVVAC